jgi:hypothetical protein
MSICTKRDIKREYLMTFCPAGSQHSTAMADWMPALPGMCDELGMNDT